MIQAAAEATQAAPNNSIPIQYFTEEEHLHVMHVEQGFPTLVSTRTIALEDRMENRMETNWVMMAQNPISAQNHGLTHSETWTYNFVIS